MMRALVCSSMAVGVISQGAVHAQAPGAGVDFSGIYVGEDPYQQPDVFPFTAEGRRAQNAHDPFAGDPSQWDCIPEVMPQILLWGTTIMEVTREDGEILMTVERGATVRTIHMEGSPPAADEPHTALGYSVGHWEDGALTVETTHVEDGVLFAEEGYPVSREARTTERYWRNPGEMSLQMELVIDDSVNYTEPVVIEREWIWSPEEQVHPYNCFSLELDESGPVDMEALKRRLEQL